MTYQEWLKLGDWKGQDKEQAMLNAWNSAIESSTNIKKLRLNVTNLFSERSDGLLSGATANFDIEILDELGAVIGRASVDLLGKIGPNSSYVKEYDLTKEKPCVT